VSASPEGTVFSRPFWIRAAAEAQGGVPRFSGVFEEGRLAAGMSFVELERGPFKKASTPAATPYGGMLYRPNTQKRQSKAESYNIEFADALIAYLEKRYSHVFLVHAPGFLDLRPFTWAGWSSSVHYTYVLDLQDIDRLWDHIERRVWTVIRNAEASLERGGPVDTARFGELYEHIYRDRGMEPPTPTGLVTSLLDEIMQSGRAEMCSVREPGGDVISVMVFVFGAKTVYAWTSGSLPGENASGATSLLLWDAARRYAGSFSSLDLVGANIRSIAYFKKGFGGTLQPYYTSERYSSHMSEAAMKTYTKMKKLI